MVSSSAGIRVEGAANLRRTMRKAGEDLGALQAAHAAAGAIAGRRAQADAPKRSGRLASNVRWSGTKTAAVIRVGGARVPYAGPIHWGWPRRHISAHPFVTDAAVATESQWSAVYQAAVERILGRVKGV
jgi:hypothetical protein